MSYQSNNNIKKKSLFLLPCVFLLLLLIGIQKTSAASLNCGDISDPEKSKGSIITILEEEISSGSGDNAAGEEIITCIRKTTFDAAGKATPEYVSLGACTPAEKVKCKRVQVYIAGSGAELLYRYVGSVYRWAAGTIGIVCVLLLVFGGISVASAGGDSGKIEKAKTKIMQSLAGLVLLFLSALILYTVNPNFFTK